VKGAFKITSQKIRKNISCIEMSLFDKLMQTRKKKNAAEDLATPPSALQRKIPKTVRKKLGINTWFKKYFS
jgi:hypothetical protein